jgi:hypothetical protein
MILNAMFLGVFFQIVVAVIQLMVIGFLIHALGNLLEGQTDLSDIHMNDAAKGLRASVATLFYMIFPLLLALVVYLVIGSSLIASLVLIPVGLVAFVAYQIGDLRYAKDGHSHGMFAIFENLGIVWVHLPETLFLLLQQIVLLALGYVALVLIVMMMQFVLPGAVNEFMANPTGVGWIHLLFQFLGNVLLFSSLLACLIPLIHYAGEIRLFARKTPENTLELEHLRVG